MLLVFYFAFFLGTLSQVSHAESTHETVCVHVLDKTFARTQHVEASLNQPIHHDTLTVIVRKCTSQTTVPPIDTLSFVEVYDAESNPKDGLIFSGWLSTKNPAVSTLDHPRYDVWVDQQCK